METRLACLTPPGKAAIAVLAVAGPRAWTITRQLFQPRHGTLPEEAEPGTFRLGRLGIDSRDDVILAVKAILPCPALELHCHGGIAVVRMVQELYEQNGVQIVSWQNLEAISAFVPFDAAAKILALLAHAPTTRTASILLDQAHGAERIFASDPARHDRLRELIPLGQHLVEPWKVVIAGAPNVGKSSLMNALAGYTRSIVSPTPGTTRDVVTVSLAIDGWPIEMTDTAGLRQTPNALEQQGIRRARAVLEQADLRIWLFDGSTEKTLPDDAAGWCFLINKTDLPAGWKWDEISDALRISAQTGEGLPELCEFLSRRLVPHPPAPGEAVPCLPEHWAWLATIAAKEQADGVAR